MTATCAGCEQWMAEVERLRAVGVELAGDKLDLGLEIERLREGLEMIRQGPPPNLRPERHHDWARGIVNTWLGPL